MSVFSRLSNLFAGSANQPQQPESAPVVDLEPPAPVLEVQPEPPVTAVLVSLSTKTTQIPAQTYSNFVGLEVKEFLSQVFPGVDISRVSQLTLVNQQGLYVSLGLDDKIPAELPAQIAVSTSSGRGE